jgi:hypothetical protein
MDMKESRKKDEREWGYVMPLLKLKSTTYGRHQRYLIIGYSILIPSFDVG